MSLAIIKNKTLTGEHTGKKPSDENALEFQQRWTLQLQKKGQGEPILIYFWEEDRIFLDSLFFKSVRHFVRLHTLVFAYTSKEIPRNLPESNTALSSGLAEGSLEFI